MHCISHSLYSLHAKVYPIWSCFFFNPAVERAKTLISDHTGWANYHTYNPHIFLDQNFAQALTISHFTWIWLMLAIAALVGEGCRWSSLVTLWWWPVAFKADFAVFFLEVVAVRKQRCRNASKPVFMCLLPFGLYFSFYGCDFCLFSFFFSCFLFFLFVCLFV